MSLVQLKLSCKNNCCSLLTCAVITLSEKMLLFYLKKVEYYIHPSV